MSSFLPDSISESICDVNTRIAFLVNLSFDKKYSIFEPFTNVANPWLVIEIVTSIVSSPLASASVFTELTTASGLFYL